MQRESPRSSLAVDVEMVLPKVIISCHSQDTKRRSKLIRRKRLAIAEHAAQRCLQSNGCTPNLPTLCKIFSESAAQTHPYGVRPYGNIFASPNGDKVRMHGCGNIRILNDEQIMFVLEYLDAYSLCQLCACSRFLYVAVHADASLFRDATLTHYEQTCTPIRSFTSGTWKDQYIWTRQKPQSQQTTQQPPRYHKPIRVDGIYSDVFYRTFLCRRFDFDKDDSFVDNIDRVPASEMDAARFINTYEQPNIPVIIEGAASSWPALQKWSSLEYVRNVTTDTETSIALAFRATSGTASVPANFTLDAYWQYCNSQAALHDESPLYLFDRTFAKRAPKLHQDYQPLICKTVPYLSPDASHGHDLFGLLDTPTSGRRPDFQWMICGPHGSGSAFHIDPNATHAWNAPILGRKRWILYPPSVTPPGVHPSPDGDTVTMPLSIGEWLLTFGSQHFQNRSKSKRDRPIECIVEPGDLIFVPHGWWHTVVNIDPGMSIALTQNYVSSTNLANVLRFLKTRPDQISGCRDRAGEAVSPDDLLKEFTQSLEKYRPDLLALAAPQAAKGFTCPAWIDADADNKDPSARHINVKQPSLWEKTKSTNEQAGGGFSFSFL